MKKLALLLMTFLFAFSVVQAQTQKAEKGKVQEVKKEQKTERVPLKKLEGIVVSETAKNSFLADFPKASTPSWRRAGTYDEVVFTIDGKKMTAFYDYRGKLVGTTSAKMFTDLPSKAQQEIKTRYKDYTIGPVIFFKDNDLNDTDMILWATQFDDEDLYFVELTKGTSKIIVRVTPAGFVSLFKEL